MALQGQWTGNGREEMEKWEWQSGNKGKSERWRVGMEEWELRNNKGRVEKRENGRVGMGGMMHLIKHPYICINLLRWYWRLE